MKPSRPSDPKPRKILTPQQRREIRGRLLSIAQDVRTRAYRLDAIIRDINGLEEAAPVTTAVPDAPAVSRQAQPAPAPAPAPAPQPNAFEQFLASFYREVQQFARTLSQFASEGADFLTGLPPEGQEFMLPPEMRRDAVPGETAETAE